MKRCVIFCIVLSFILFGCTQASATPEGVVRICKQINDSQYLLLYNNAVREDKKQPPVNYDTFCIYDIQKNRHKTVFSGTNIWEGFENQLINTEEHVIFNSNGVNLIQFSTDETPWMIERTIHSTAESCVVSPSASKIVQRLANHIEIVDMETGELISQRTNVSGIGKMVWNDAETLIAMTANNGTSIDIWNLLTDEVLEYSVYDTLAAPADWVDIIDIVFLKNSTYLLVHYLCENGSSITLWDMEKNVYVDSITPDGDITVLNVADHTILYEVEPVDGTMHILQIYDCTNRQSSVIDRFEGVYTAGTIIEGSFNVLVNRYDAQSKTNALMVLKADSAGIDKD